MKSESLEPTEWDLSDFDEPTIDDALFVLRNTFFATKPENRAVDKAITYLERVKRLEGKLTFDERCVLRFYQLKAEQERVGDDWQNDPLAKVRVSLTKKQLLEYNRNWGVTVKGLNFKLEEG